MSFKDKILNNQSPWGSPPGSGDGSRGSPSGNGSGSRQDPPSIDDVIKNLQKTINKFSGGKSGGSRPIVIGLIIIALLYVASGLYRVLPDEQGVVLRFGKYVNTTQPGLHYHIPTPFERVLTPKVTKVNRVDVGFRPASDTGRSSGVGNVPEESLMLTGDENIVVTPNAILLWDKDQK
jgi:membrane protease subunit HflK